jgi:hypothetical protein
MSGSMPRPGVLVLLGVALIAGVFMLSRRGGNEETASTPAPPAPTTAAPAQGAAAAAPSTPGTAATPAPAKPASPGKSQSRTLPAAVSKAFKSHKVVVLLFWNRRGVDDRAVRSAVSGLPRHGGKVAVFTDDLKHLARYTRVTAGANVTETPTLVVTNRKGAARVATGYLDPDTVEQYVVDALHGAP